MAVNIDPKTVWNPSLGKYNTGHKLFCDVEQCHPWTKKEDLPGRSYKTSSRLGHPRIYPYFTFVETKPLELGQDKMLRDYRFKDINYRTSYRSAYTKKCDCSGTTEKPNAPHSLKFKMLFNWADKLRNAPIRKTFECLSEMKDNYRLHLPDETRDTGGMLSDLRPHVICNISAVAKDAQSKTSSEEKCIQKVLDPYISTQQYDYVYHTPNEIAKYKHKNAEPIELIIPKKTPVYDETFLRLKFLDRFIRKKVPSVPHSGWTTEIRDNYKLPLSELAHKKNLYCSSITRSALTKGEVKATPAMYNTEYSHYGHDWPLTSLI